MFNSYRGIKRVVEGDLELQIALGFDHSQVRAHQVILWLRRLDLKDDGVLADVLDCDEGLGVLFSLSHLKAHTVDGLECHLLSPVLGGQALAAIIHKIN